MSILLAGLVDAAIVLALGLIAGAVLRRRSAALRHAIVATAIITAALMPVFELVVPQLPIIQWYAPGTVISSGLTLTSGDAVSGSEMRDLGESEGGIPWTTLFIAVWMAGAIVTCAGLVTGLVRLARLRNQCRPVSGRWRELTEELSRQCGVRRHVTLLQSGDPSLLVTCGVLSPRIILPAGASEWTDDRRRIVLRHELAHISRHDAAIQIAGEALRIFHWINPLVWLACRRLRQESEYACDDAVLSGGVEATDYATHLLDVARHLSGRHTAWASAPAIAHPSTLERRIVAMLHRQRNRTPLGRAGWSVAAVAALSVGIPLAAAAVAPAEQEIVVPSNTTQVDAAQSSTPAQVRDVPPRTAAQGKHGRATLAGRVLDQSGAVMPGVQLTLTNTQTSAQRVVHSDAGGEFAFSDLEPARYELVANLPGFAAVRNILTLPSGSAIQRTLTLPLGTLQETITVTCSGTPAVSGARLSASVRSGVARLSHLVTHAISAAAFPVLSAQEPANAEPIRVGGNVRAPRKIKDVKPQCPPTGPSTETVVRLTGRVGVDGIMNDVAAVPAEPGAEAPTELIESVQDAVRQWVFTPTLLNGRPVEVTINVRVTFKS